MGAGDHHRRDDSNQPPILGEGEDGGISAAPAAVVVGDNNNNTVVAIAADGETPAVALTTTEDIWATQEGYTPLQDMQLMNGGGDDEAVLFSHGAGGGGTTTIFGAGGDDGGAFLASLLAAENDEEEESSDDADEEKDAMIPNFRDVADNALSLLEDDYFRTVQATTQQQESSSVANNEKEDEDLKVASQIEALTDPNYGDNASQKSTAPANNNDNVVSDFADFESGPQEQQQKVELPDIDVVAVQRAVATIGTRDAKLRSNFAEWEQRQKAAAVTAPRLHTIIPKAPLSAFRRQTDKARQATTNLSRSATLAEALKRFNLLKRDIDRPSDANILRIHVVGCDRVECESPERLRTLFGPMVRWIGAYAEAPTHLELDLIGPNVPLTAVSTGPLDMMAKSNNVRNIMESAVLRCHCALYEDWLAADAADSEGRSLPDLAIAFNAGCWGYREWKTTIQYLVQRKKEQSIPFVFTAYTMQEAEDDYDVIQEAITECSNSDDDDHTNTTAACSWEPAGNPFMARQDRPTATALPGRQYRENAAWQGWLF